MNQDIKFEVVPKEFEIAKLPVQSLQKTLLEALAYQELQKKPGKIEHLSGFLRGPAGDNCRLLRAGEVLDRTGTFLKGR